MQFRFVHSPRTQEGQKAYIEEKASVPVAKVVETTEIIQKHFEHLESEFLIKNPIVTVVTVNLNQKTVREACKYLKTYSPVPKDLIRRTNPKARKHDLKEMKKEMAFLKEVVTNFGTGQTESFVLCVVSKTFKGYRRAEYILCFPDSIRSVRVIDDNMAECFDKSLLFNETLSPQVMGIVGVYSSCMRAAAFYADDSVMWVQLLFHYGKGNPEVRFNTGRGLDKIARTNQGREGMLCARMLAYSARNLDFFEPGDKSLFVSVVLNPTQQVMSAVRFVVPAETEKGKEEVEEEEEEEEEEGEEGGEGRGKNLVKNPQKDIRRIYAGGEKVGGLVWADVLDHDELPPLTTWLASLNIPHEGDEAEAPDQQE